MSTLSETILLGDDTDCETCGMSYNRIDYEYDLTDKTHAVYVTLGCYGGESIVDADTYDAIALVRKYNAPFADELNTLFLEGRIW